MLRQAQNTIPLTATRISTDPLHFYPLSVDELPKIQALLNCSGTRSCDYTIGGLYIWKDLFKYEYCIYNNTLFIKGLNENGDGSTAFSMPCGFLPLREAFEILRRHAALSGDKLILSAVPEDKLEDVRALSQCSVTELEPLADYIYDAQSLATLTGKAYNKKRNHVNRFMAENPGYKLEMIDDSNIADVRTFFRTLGIESDKANPELAEYEWEQCMHVIENYNSYAYIGGLLRGEDGRVVAFTIGEIYGDTLILHIEKAEHLVAGSGETINKLFAAKVLEEYPDIKYINREDAAGDPGLKFAKESYHPAFMLKKFNVSFE